MLKAMTIASEGMRAAEDRFNVAASTIAGQGADSSPSEAGAPVDRVDLSRAAVDLLSAKTDFEANVAVLRIANRMMGRLLDTVA